MARLLMTAMVLLLFVLEGTVVQVISPSTGGLSWMTVPRFALVCTILISMFLGRREGLYYGLAFGFLQDVLYGQVIGIYSVSMMLTSYFSGMIVLLFQRGFGMVIITSILIIFGHEWLLYSMYRMFSLAPHDVQWILSSQILPTVVLNGLFTLVIYMPIRRLCKLIESKKDLSAKE